MLHNLLIDWKDETAESGIVEPLTVQEVKNYLRLEGFIDNNESLATDFDDDNTLIAELITSARLGLEEYTGLSFIPKTWEIEFDNYAGNFEIPFGPVNSVNSLKDSQGDTISASEYSLSINNRVLKTPTWGELVLNYEAGYTTLPARLKDAMLKDVAYRYMNRGDVNVDGISREAEVLASSYKTSPTWLG
jgi:uncharacterized phiE125 gp8 family phage protein